MNFCPTCGTPRQGRFCAGCGFAFLEASTHLSNDAPGLDPEVDVLPSGMTYGDEFDASVHCVNCGMNTSGAARCSSCA